MAKIKLTNGVQISSPNVELKGFDTTNVLATYKSPGSNINHSYTATEDCFLVDMSCFIYYGSTVNMPQIDGVRVVDIGSRYTYINDGHRSPTIFPLKKGQIWSNHSEGSTLGEEGKITYIVFGCK